MDDARTTIAGHPLVRLLRRDHEREVWVAAAEDGSGVELHRGLEAGDAAIAREAEAVAAAAHPHLVPVLDQAADGGAVLVLPLLPRDLAGWLVARGAPEAGEAVTALAPVAAALGALHAVGAAAGGIALQDVRLDADGAPLLHAAGAAIETSPPTRAWRDASEAVARDVAAWRDVAEAVLDAAGAALPPEVESALAERDLAAAGEALLEAWPALPLALEPPRRAAEPAPRTPLRRRERSAAERAAGIGALWERVAALLDRAVARGASGSARELLRAPALAARAVRPRFWLAAGAGAVALALAGGLAAAADGGPPPTSTSAEPAPSGAPPAPSTPAPLASPTSEAPPPEPPQGAAPTPAADGAAAGALADPAAATEALLAEREACLDAADAACLVALHDPASPLLAAEEPWRMPVDGRAEPVQRLGEAWLLRIVSQTAPASVLVMSTEAGWVLRDAWSD